MAGYAPLIPLTRVDTNSTDNTYKMVTDLKQLILQNVITLLMTSPGERVFMPDYGVGLRNYLFDQYEEDLPMSLVNRINDQFKKYLSFLDLLAVERITGSESSQTISIAIRFYSESLTAAQEAVLNYNLNERSVNYAYSSGNLEEGNYADFEKFANED